MCLVGNKNTGFSLGAINTSLSYIDNVLNFINFFLNFESRSQGYVTEDDLELLLSLPPFFEFCGITAGMHLKA